MADTELAGDALRRSTGGERRTPRFSWNPQYEETFFRSLCESMTMGYKENHSFKAGAWERAAIALRDKHQAFPEKSHLINKADNARKKFRMWRGLREDPDFLYNPNTKMVTAPEEAWRRHIDKEPLSKALRGRPYEHEEYMEILFPDVVGSGGAPKRIMKPRKRNPDGTLATPTRHSDVAANHEQPQPGSLDALMDSPYTSSSLQPHQQQLQQEQQQHSQTQASPSQRPGSAAAPAAASAASSSALTPPDEQQQHQQTPGSTSAQQRKRPYEAISSTPGSAQQQHQQQQQSPFPGERRRGRPSRFAANFYQTSSVQPPPATFSANPRSLPNNAGAGGPSSSAHGTPSSSSSQNHHNNNQQASSVGGGGGPVSLLPHSSHPSHQAASGFLLQEGLLQLADAVRAASSASSSPKWQERAVEILFRDFEHEEADLQLKIAEKALTDENKAMVFVKMTPALRSHWVGRLREVHLRNSAAGVGGAGGGLGRVIEEGG